jgi:hypothetical protein
MQNLDLGELIACRARLQRHEDAKSFYAWVQDVDVARLIVLTNEACPLEVGQRFHVEVFGEKAKVMMEACLSAKRNDTLFSFAIKSPLTSLPATEDARRCVFGVTLEGTLDGEPFKGEVTDMSPSGIGFLCDRPLSSGATIAIVVSGKCGQLSCEAQIRYCRQLSGEETKFRVGAQLGQLDRIQRALWHRQLKAVA